MSFYYAIAFGDSLESDTSPKFLAKLKNSCSFIIHELLNIASSDEPVKEITSLESKVESEKEGTTIQYFCYNIKNKQMQVYTLTDKGVTRKESQGYLCFKDSLSSDVLVTGFWYELCFEF